MYIGDFLGDTYIIHFQKKTSYLYSFTLWISAPNTAFYSLKSTGLDPMMKKNVLLSFFY